MIHIHNFWVTIKHITFPQLQMYSQENFTGNKLIFPICPQFLVRKGKEPVFNLIQKIQYIEYVEQSMWEYMFNSIYMFIELNTQLSDSWPSFSLRWHLVERWVWFMRCLGNRRAIVSPDHQDVFYILAHLSSGRAVVGNSVDISI